MMKSAIIKKNPGITSTKVVVHVQMDDKDRNDEEFNRTIDNNDRVIPEHNFRQRAVSFSRRDHQDSDQKMICDLGKLTFEETNECIGSFKGGTRHIMTKDGKNYSMSETDPKLIMIANLFVHELLIRAKEEAQLRLENESGVNLYSDQFIYFPKILKSFYFLWAENLFENVQVLVVLLRQL